MHDALTVTPSHVVGLCGQAASQVMYVPPAVYYLCLQVVYVGERAVDYNPAFKLYLVTRNATPALTPDVAPLLTVTNFSITRSGLESKCSCHLMVVH